jgi:hypothetical protein
MVIGEVGVNAPGSTNGVLLRSIIDKIEPLKSSDRAKK